MPIYSSTVAYFSLIEDKLFPFMVNVYMSGSYRF